MTTKAKIWLTILVPLLIVGAILITWYIMRRAKSSADVPVAGSSTTVTTAVGATTTTTAVSEKPKMVLQAGWNLATIPYICSPNDGKIIFMNVQTKEVSTIQSGQWTSVFTSGTISPGQGIWIHSQNGEVYEIPIPATPVDSEKSFTISLAKGENALGNPYPLDITFNPTVKTSKGTATLAKAQEAKIVGTVYVTDPVSNKYVELKAGDKLKKFQGFIMAAGGENMQLIFSPPAVAS